MGSASLAAARPTARPDRDDNKTDYEKHRKREFLKSWGDEFLWVRCEDNIMLCSVCRTYPHTSDPQSTLVKGIAGNKRRETLVSHETSKAHIQCMKHKENNDKKARDRGIGQLEKCVQAQVTKLNQEQESILTSLTNTALYVVKKKVAFDAFSSLCELQEKNGLNLGTQYRRDKSCKEFVIAIADQEKENTIQSIKASRFVAVMGDGSTDVSITEQEGVHLRYWKFH